MLEVIILVLKGLSFAGIKLLLLFVASGDSQLYWLGGFASGAICVLVCVLVLAIYQRRKYSCSVKNYLSAGITLLLMVMLSTLTFVGCNGSSDDRNRLVNLSFEKVFVNSSDSGCFEFESEDEAGNVYTGWMYTYEHAFGQDKIDRFCVDRQYSGEVDLLVAEGFRVSVDRSKHIETTTLDGIDFSITILVLEQEIPFDSTYIQGEESYAFLRYSSIRGYAESFQLEKLFIGRFPMEYWDLENSYCEAIGCDSLLRVMWSQSFEPVVRVFLHDAKGSPMVDPPDSTYDPEGWDWVLWSKCVTSSSGIGCAAAAGGCLMSSEPYDDCTGEGCLQATLAAIISCSADQIW
jgi:hypothetical protein